jgi:high-affinity Fe2+/Pb2+ permease
MKALAYTAALAAWITAAALVPVAVAVAGGWRALVALIFASVLAAGLGWIGVALFEHAVYLGKRGK